MYRRADEKFRLVSYVSADRGAVTYAASRFPIMSWPDGSWCLEANLYLERMHKKRQVIADRPDGTVLAYAGHLNHFIRFCFEREISFLEVTNDEFVDFVEVLEEERKAKNESLNARDFPAIRAIGTTVLSFIHFCGQLYGLSDLVGVYGQIQASPASAFTPRNRRKERDLEIRHFAHAALPLPSPVQRRRPISTEALRKLRAAAYKVGGEYVQKRRSIMLLLLEAVGGRREETGRLRVEHLLRTLSQPTPKIELPWLAKKRQISMGRTVDVSAADAEQIIAFIRYERPRVLRVKTRTAIESGPLFLDQRRGTPIRHETLSKEFRALVAIAGLTEKACIHMMRHRFITNLVKSYLVVLSKQLTSPLELKHAILHYGSIKAMIREEMGFASEQSLKVYIHEAYEEVVGESSIKKEVLAFRKAAQILNDIEDILAKHGSSPERANEEIRQYVGKIPAPH